MTQSIKPNILIIAGATASGKSALALSIAQKTAKENRNSVIINADSQQLYQELRILTARPTPEEEALAPHKLYGIMPAAQPASVGIWLKLARMEIDWARSTGVQPIVVGGTGMYLKALMEGIAEIPDVASEVRQQATRDYEHMGKEAFSERLKTVDPEFFQRLQAYDRQRLIRAYEVWLGTGKPLGFWQTQKAEPAYAKEEFRVKLVDIPRDELYRRCDQRFITMIEQGAIEEVKHLVSLNLSSELPAMKSVGVKELSDYLISKCTIDEAIEKSQQSTRNYAKRQLTWFRNQLNNY